MRDVAKAHRLAIEKDAADGQRLACSSNSNTSFLRWTRLLRKHFKSYGYSLPSIAAPYPLVAIMGLWDKQARSLKGDLGKKLPMFSSEKIVRVLGIEFVDEDKTLLDHFNGCVQVGVQGCKMTSKYKAALDAGTIEKTER